MRGELTDLQPKLEVAQKETEEKIIIVDANKKEAEVIEESVRK